MLPIKTFHLSQLHAVIKPRVTLITNDEKEFTEYFKLDYHHNTRHIFSTGQEDYDKRLSIFTDYLMKFDANYFEHFYVADPAEDVDEYNISDEEQYE